MRGRKMDVASFLQSAIVVMIVVIVVGFVGTTVIEKLQEQQNGQERKKELQNAIEKMNQDILEIQNLLTGKKDYCERERKNLNTMYDATFQLLNEVGFRHMGTYISAHIGKERYENLLRDKERYLNYKEGLAKRSEDYSYLHKSFEDYIEREMDGFTDLEKNLEQNLEEVGSIVENVNHGLESVKKSIVEMKPLKLENHLELLSEEELENVNRLVKAGEVRFSSIIHATVQEKGKPNTRIWANHLPYDAQTGEPIYGCFEVDDMVVDEDTLLGDKLFGETTGLHIAACQGYAGLLFGDNPFTLSFINEDGEKEVLSQIKEYYLKEKMKYTVDCQLGDRQWIITFN